MANLPKEESPDQRRRRDLNPRACYSLLVFEARPFSHLGTPPIIQSHSIRKRSAMQEEIFGGIMSMEQSPGSPHAAPAQAVSLPRPRDSAGGVQHTAAGRLMRLS